jgi:surface polysaccharide O-acyltransferase-like enzyme
VKEVALDGVRAWAALAVVCLHVAAGFVLTLPGLSVGWWAAVFWDALCRWCVPAFVVLSGYLLGDAQKCASIRGFYQQRLPRLFWLVFVWSTIYGIWRLWLPPSYTQSLSSLAGWLEALQQGKPMYHLWYLFMLPGLYLLLPLLQRLFDGFSRRGQHQFVLASFVFAMLLNLYPSLLGQTIPWLLWAALYLPYALLGMYWRRHGVPQVAHVWGVLACLWVLLWFAGAWQLTPRLAFWGWEYLSPWVVLQSLAVLPILLQNQRLHVAGLWRWLARHSLAIYLLHPMLLEHLRHQSWFVDTPVTLWLWIPLAALVLSLICALLNQIILYTPLKRMFA